MKISIISIMSGSKLCVIHPQYWGRKGVLKLPQRYLKDRIDPCDL